MAKKKKAYLPVEKLEDALYQWFNINPNQSFNTKHLIQAVRVNPEDSIAFGRILDKLVSARVVKRLPQKRYKFAPARTKHPKGEGIIMMSRSGYAFVSVEGRDEDIYVSVNKLHGALHGDRVRLNIAPSKSSRRSVEGEVVEILERSKRPYIGIVQIQKNRIYVISDNRFLPYDIRIPSDELHGAKNGDKVAVLVTGFTEGKNEPLGRIIDVLGLPGDNDTEMHAILAEFGLPYRFNKEVEEDADKIPDKITKKDIAERRDFRDITTFTIDPADAKDFDDALSIRQLDSGNWEVGVHIADVTHYVHPNTLVDEEALARATSVYLVDRTVPMLPEHLSNKLCSLRPKEEKLCFSAVFELDKDAKIVHRWIGRTIICSNHRFDYDNAQEIIETKKGIFSRELLTLHRLAKKIRDKRFKNGALSFDVPEPKVEVDKKGKPVKISFREMKDSNFLIEEFMLLANCAVAEIISTAPDSKTFIYRIHDEPSLDRLTAFRDFVKHLGYKMGATKTKRDIAREMNRLLETAKDKPECHAIEMMSLRTMARAVYSTNNIGHYGLAFDNYTHFTSPIRRYPDMMVHRLLALYMSGGASQDKAQYEGLCKHSSQREQLAADAERASIKYKMVEFMQNKEGQEFDGVISGVTESGIYVELNENGIEGYVSQRDLKGDMFVYTPEQYMYKGRRTGKTYSFGNAVRIRLDRVRLDQKLLDFVMAEEE
jgi:ribonuclease R